MKIGTKKLPLRKLTLKQIRSWRKSGNYYISRKGLAVYFGETHISIIAEPYRVVIDKQNQLLQIGCQRHPLSWWQKHGEEMATNHLWPEDRREQYRIYISLAARILRAAKAVKSRSTSHKSVRTKKK